MLNPLESAIARRIDFPTWLPAMLVKELRQGLRARGFVATLVGFQVLMTLFTVFAIAGGSGSTSYNILQGAFWVMLNVQLLVITPMRALAGLQSELDSRWVDLLMLTRLTAWRIVVGKWISLLVQSALLVFAMLPYGVARYFFGSVDLIGEARLIALIFAGSAVLTAGALWSSALPRLARVALAIAVIFMWQIVPGSAAALISSIGSSRPVRPVTGSIGLSGLNWSLLMFDAALLLTVCLVGAARRLAPRAESQTAIARLLPLLGFLALPFLSGRELAGQAVVTSIFFALVAALELARDEEPMDSHWRTWARHGWWGRLLGRFVQPGWASATEWVIAVAAIAAAIALGQPKMSLAALSAVLVAEALVFPALMLTWMSSQFTHRAAGYALVLGGASLLAAVGAATGSITGNTALADRVLMMLPISSFWTLLPMTNLPAAPVLTVQLLGAAAVLGCAWWRARPYRLQQRAWTVAPEDTP